MRLIKGKQGSPGGKHRIVGIMTALALVVAACQTQPVTETPVVVAPVAPETVPPLKPIPQAEQSLPPRSLGVPQVMLGKTPLVGSPNGTPASHVEASGTGDVSFNFVNADLRDVLREILGEQLHLSYAVDSKVQATITAQTGAPLPRAAVLPALESILQSNGLDLVASNGVYRVVPVDVAAKASLGAADRQGQPGYGVRILPMRYGSASRLKDLLQPFLPPGGVMQVDGERNLLIVSGPMADLDGIAGLVRQFDVDWLSGTSFAIYPLKIGTAKNVADELQSILGDNASGPLGGVVRIVPIERLNAILVISAQPRYLAEVKDWVDRLDTGNDETTPRLFQYRVQNSRAVDLAAVLTKLLSSGQVSTVQPETAPGTQAAKQIMSQSMAGGAAATPGGGTSGMSGIAGASPGAAPGTAAPSSGVTGVAGTQGQATATPGQEASNVLSPPGGGGIGRGGANELELPPIRVVADEKNNSLVIFARPRDYRMIYDAIRQLDVVPLQVLLEATIAEVTLNDSLSYGLQYFLTHGSTSNTLTTSTSGTQNSNDIAGVFPGYNYVLNGNPRIILSALSSLTHVNVISSPQLLVVDHQTAALQVGDQVPVITQSAQSVLTTGAPLVSNVEYLSTGVVLQITPRVNTNGLVTLDIDQQVSDVETTTTSSINSPTINQRRIVTSVIVQDGQSVALGGLIQDSRQKAKSGIPLLSDIPVLGPLFGTTTDTTARTELLVLVSPKIIRNGQDAHDMTEDLRNRMRDLKPLDARVH